MVDKHNSVLRNFASSTCDKPARSHRFVGRVYSVGGETLINKKMIRNFNIVAFGKEYIQKRHTAEPA